MSVDCLGPKDGYDGWWNAWPGGPAWAACYATHATAALMYGPAQLGFYALGITVVQPASILSRLGLDNGVVLYVAHHGAGGGTARVRGTIFGVLLCLGLYPGDRLFLASFENVLGGAFRREPVP
jgi:hypothetical protein